jgi:hypothetical protein
MVVVRRSARTLFKHPIIGVDTAVLWQCDPILTNELAKWLIGVSLLAMSWRFPFSIEQIDLVYIERREFVRVYFETLKEATGFPEPSDHVAAD